MNAEAEEFKNQLRVVQQQLLRTTSEEERRGLIQLESNIKELIQLANQSEPSGPLENKDDEYKLFMEELAALERTSEEESRNSEVSDLHSDLKELEGTKCQAPFKHKWCEHAVFHNALVFTVLQPSESSDVHVTVMFTHPTHEDMKPCPYFLEGSCRFTADKCRFSHGEAVSLDSLREYKEPNFDALTSGSRVLVKQEDGLWAFAKIVNVLGDKYSLRMEQSSTEIEVDVGNVFPIGDDTEEDEERPENERSSICDFPRILQQMPTSSVIGGWEKFTKGFGSRIMQKMGYIVGEGLGVKSDGRIEPVSAVIYPAGKSLDHCMMLKEVGGDEDMFKAERKMLKLQKKHEEALARSSNREQHTDVFSFINSQIGTISEKQSEPASSKSAKLNSLTKEKLNVSRFQVAENTMKLEKERKKLMMALSRHPSGTPVHMTIKDKLNSCEGKIKALQASEEKISKELKIRDNKKKLTIF